MIEKYRDEAAELRGDDAAPQGGAVLQVGSTEAKFFELVAKLDEEEEKKKKKKKKA
ncbi:MAG: hypothetical protein M1822_008362 [Bathelium mastoideum]|nr:MAG: hypothetical protein M1822_008362 [Bathelium mastoideum]